MKDSEFIELLNLYLDHEITAGDAARLEAEVQGSPARRAVYQQYCRMQKACTLLTKDFNDQLVLAEDASGGRKVVAFDQPRRTTRGSGVFVAGGLLAAAACVALVLVNRTAEPTPTAEAPAMMAARGAVAPVVAPIETKVLVAQPENFAAHANIARTVTVPASRRNELQPVLAMHSFALSGSVDSADQTASTDLPAQLDWIGGLKIAPMQLVQVEDLRFEARPVQPAKNPTYGNPRRLEQGIVEKTAFQFQK